MGFSTASFLDLCFSFSCGCCCCGSCWLVLAGANACVEVFVDRGLEDADVVGGFACALALAFDAVEPALWRAADVDGGIV